MPNSKILLK